MLWNAKHPRHFNKILRNDAWEELAFELNTTAEESSTFWSDWTLVGYVLRTAARVGRTHRVTAVRNLAPFNLGSRRGYVTGLSTQICTQLKNKHDKSRNVKSQ
jgi:hypothetical protein